MPGLHFSGLKVKARRLNCILPALIAIPFALSGCVSTVIPEADLAKNLIVGRIQTAVNDYCKKPEDLRLAYRAIAAEATYPHQIQIECASVAQE